LLDETRDIAERFERARKKLYLVGGAVRDAILMPLAARRGIAFTPRTIVEVRRLNQDDIFEVEGTFYVPVTG